MTVTEETRPRYPAIGNNIALDFTNTVDWHASDRPQDRIGSYSDLISWALQAGSLTREQATYLIDAQKVRPDEAATALETARGLREAIYRLVLAATTKRPPTATDLESLNRVLREGFLRLKVTAMQEAFGLQWADDDVLMRPIWPVAWAASQLLTSSDLTRVKQCASADGCGWLFLDRSKNLSRRWCDMRACGNTAKARRYRKRQESAGGAGAT